MIIYGDERRIESAKGLLDRLALDIAAQIQGGAHDVGALRDLLIAAGELEQGLLDGAGGYDARVAMELGSVVRKLGSALFFARIRGRGKEYLGDALAALTRLQVVELAAEIEVRTPEGFAYYALYPEQYQDAIAALQKAKGIGSALVIGVRSIGTTLAGAVAGALVTGGCYVRSFTVRPTGHPFSRELQFTAWQQQQIATMGPDSWFIVVDEGPGMSGSSLAAVGAALMGLGVPAQRIVFMPGHGNGPGSAASDEVRRIWRSVVVQAPPTADLPGLIGFGALAPANIAPDYSPFARISFMGQRDGEAALFAFAGLGYSGQRALAWAERLVAAGLCKGPVSLHNGFLISPYASRLGLERASDQTLVSLTRLIEIAVSMGSQARPTEAQMQEMIYWNTWEALGAEQAELVKKLSFAWEGEAAGAIFSGLLPGDWYQEGDSLLLRRPLGGMSGHTVVNAASAAWHVAALAAGWDLRNDETIQLVAELKRTQKPDVAQLFMAEIAFAAYGVGLAKTCAPGSATPDFWGLRYDRHRQALIDHLARIRIY